MCVCMFVCYVHVCAHAYLRGVDWLGIRMLITDNHFSPAEPVPCTKMEDTCGSPQRRLSDSFTGAAATLPSEEAGRF